MKVGASLAFFAILALCAMAFGQTTGLENDYTKLFVIPSWLGLVSVGLAIAVAIIAISFMVGEALNLPSVKAFCKQEIYELIATIIIVVLVIGGLVAYGQFAKNVASSALIAPEGGDAQAVVGFCKESQKIYDTNDAAHPENLLFADVDWFLGCFPLTSQSEIYLQNLQNGEIDYSQNVWDEQAKLLGIGGSGKGVMLGHMMNIFLGLLSLEFLLGPISTFGVSAFLTEPILSSISLDMAPNAGLTPVSEAIIMLTDTVGIGMVTIIVQKVLLEFVHQNALTVFLPLGVGFKAIPFLRKTGATIIALALVMYFVFPISIWINQQIYFNSLYSYDEEGNVKNEMIDWTNYHSMLEICTPLPGETYGEFEQRVRSEFAQGYYQQTQTFIQDVGIGAWDVENDRFEVNTKLPSSHQKALLESFSKNSMIAILYMGRFESITGPILPVEYFFEAVIDQFTTSMQWFVLNLLFLASTIILCVTLFKDISLAIGGEPRIFGMSRLL